MLIIPDRTLCCCREGRQGWLFIMLWWLDADCPEQGTVLLQGCGVMWTK